MLLELFGRGAAAPSWQDCCDFRSISPKIVEVLVDGSQPKGLNQRVLLSCDLPID